MNRHNAYWLTIMPSLLLSPIAHADIVGTWTGKGTLNTTFNKPVAHQTVMTAGDLNETWIFNADNTFTRGTLSGTWKQKRGSAQLYDVVYDKTAYISQLNDFWTNLGITVSKIQILESKLQIREISNGIVGEETLKYKVNVTEASGIRTVTVAVSGKFFAPNGNTENTAIIDMFPTMSAGSSSQLYNISAFTTTQIANITTSPISALTSDQISCITTNPISALTSAQISNLNTNPISALTSTQISNLTNSPIPALPSLPTTAITSLGQ